MKSALAFISASSLPVLPQLRCLSRVYFRFRFLNNFSKNLYTFIQIFLYNISRERTCMNIHICGALISTAIFKLETLNHRWYWGEICFSKPTKIEYEHWMSALSNEHQYDVSIWTNILCAKLVRLLFDTSLALCLFGFSSSCFLFSADWLFGMCHMSSFTLYLCATDHFKFIYSNPHHSFI